MAARGFAMLKIIFLLICAAVVFFFWGGIVWIPFVVFSLFIALKYMKPSAVADKKSAFQMVPTGAIGSYEIDGEVLYGMFVSIENREVFLDIKIDKLKKKREALAMNIFKNCDLIEKNIMKFRINNAEFKGDYVDSFGLHSDDLGRVEVFWNSGRYSLMKNFQFLKNT